MKFVILTALLFGLTIIEVRTIPLDLDVFGERDNSEDSGIFL